MTLAAGRAEDFMQYNCGTQALRGLQQGRQSLHCCRRSTDSASGHENLRRRLQLARSGRRGYRFHNDRFHHGRPLRNALRGGSNDSRRSRRPRCRRPRRPGYRLSRGRRDLANDRRFPALGRLTPAAIDFLEKAINLGCRPSGWPALGLALVAGRPVPVSGPLLFVAAQNVVDDPNQQDDNRNQPTPIHNSPPMRSEWCSAKAADRDSL